MPKATKTEQKLMYPPGVRDITEDISTDDLVRRLKDCAQAFQNMSQDDDNSAYIPLALHLATEFFIEHSSKDVRLLVACCIADVFRVFAPDAPYKDPNQLKVVFEFFIQQLKGLEEPKDPIFKRYFYLLENLAWVKSFNICIELEDNQAIFCQLFNLMFNIVNDNHSTKVKNFMLDMMCPLISEADTVSQELLDIILMQIIEPRKTQNKNACSLAQDILKRTSGTVEPYIQGFFNNALILGKTSESEVACHLYELIYELNAVCPSMLVAVLPQLEFKLKSNEEKERLEVTKVLARMFSDKNSALAQQNKPLWICFLGRFNDISVQVRIRCVQYSMHFLLNHPELRTDITEQLKQRQHDPEENVRYEVVMAIISAAKKDFSTVNEELLNFVKERTLDKKFKIRKEALLGLAMLYKQHLSSTNLPHSTRECISWIKNKVLHVYYQTSLEDRLLVERILHTCLVPYQSPLEERMKKLYQLFASVDDYAVKAFNELLKCQNIVRNQVKAILEYLQQPKTDDRDKAIVNKIAVLAKHLPDPVKSQEFILKFCNQLEANLRIRNLMSLILQGSVSCSEAEHNVKEVLKTLGFPVQTNSYYMIIKQLLERVAPVMIDRAGIKQLIYYVKDALLEAGSIDAELGLMNSSHRGLQLLHTLSFVFPAAFHGEVVYNELLLFLQADDENAVDITLQTLTNICDDIENKYPDIVLKLIPLLENFVEFGTVKQAKHAVQCLNVVVNDREEAFGSIIESLKKHFTLQSQYFRTALVSIGHIAYLCPDLFGTQLKSIVSKVVVKDLLMLDQDIPRGGDDAWGALDSLPDETKVKIEGMKLMVRWLLGLKNAVQPAVSTLRLLSTVILHQGDLMERQHAAPMENAWLRFTSATCMMKLCQEPNYVEAMTLEQFQILALVINDECYEVREHFAQKLHKGLISLRLPLEFMSIFSLGGMEQRKELKIQLKHHLISNINKRRDYLKQHPITTMKLFSVLPDYVLPYAIHLLAHVPIFTTYDDVPSLTKLKDCLWFLMEPLMTKNENYSFSFFKRLIENIKQTKDKQAPNDNMVNLKLYAVCDLALGIVLSKTTNFVLKDFPVEPSLPSKLYTSPDKNFGNLKTYLPPELVFTPPKKSGFEIEMFGLTSKPATPSVTTVANTVGKKPSVTTRQARGTSSTDNNQNTIGSKSYHLSHYNKPLGKRQNIVKNSTYKMINTSEGTENKAPDSGAATSLLLHRPRGRPRKNPVQIAENNSVVNKNNYRLLQHVDNSDNYPLCQNDVVEPESKSCKEGKMETKNNNSSHCKSISDISDTNSIPVTDLSQVLNLDSPQNDICNNSTHQSSLTPIAQQEVITLDKNRTSEHPSKRMKLMLEPSSPEQLSESPISKRGSRFSKILQSSETSDSSSPERLIKQVQTNFKRKSVRQMKNLTRTGRHAKEISPSQNSVLHHTTASKKTQLSSYRDDPPLEHTQDNKVDTKKRITRQKQMQVTMADKTPDRKIRNSFSKPTEKLPQKAITSNIVLKETVSVTLHRNLDLENYQHAKNLLAAASGKSGNMKLRSKRKELPEKTRTSSQNVKRIKVVPPPKSPITNQPVRTKNLVKAGKELKSDSKPTPRLNKTRKLVRKSPKEIRKTASTVSSRPQSKYKEKEIIKPSTKQESMPAQQLMKTVQSPGKRISRQLHSPKVTKSPGTSQSSSKGTPKAKLSSTKLLKSNISKSSPSSLKVHSLRKTIKLTPVANGTDSNSIGGNESPNKKRYTAASLLARAIRSSSLKARSSPKVRQAAKKGR